MPTDTPTAPPVETLSSAGVVSPAIPVAQPGGKTMPSSADTKARIADMFGAAADSDARGTKHPPGKKPDAKPAIKPPPQPGDTPDDEPGGTPEDLEFERDEPQAGDKPEDASPDTPETPDTPEGKPKGKGPDPWKVVKTYKTKTKELEAEIATLKSKLPDPEVVGSLTKENEGLKAQLKEALGELRYQNYAKHPEFLERHEKPYEESWRLAGAFVGKCKVTQPDGTLRPGSLEDITMLANLSANDPQAATTKAGEMFGDVAGRVLGYVDKIVELDEKRQQALATARKEANERGERESATQKQLRQQSVETFQRINDEQVKKHEFLRNREGDDEFNEKLAKARTYVEEALAKDLRTAKTKEEFEDLVRKKVTVRNRAIGFTALRLETKRLKAEVAALKKQVAEFKGGEPGAGEGGKGKPAITDPRDRMHAAIAAAADRTTFR